MLLGGDAQKYVSAHWCACTSNTMGAFLARSKENKGWWAFPLKKFKVAQPNWYQNCSDVSGYNICSQWRIEPGKGVVAPWDNPAQRKLEFRSGVCGGYFRECDTTRAPFALAKDHSEQLLPWSCLSQGNRPSASELENIQASVGHPLSSPMLHARSVNSEVIRYILSGYEWKSLKCLTGRVGLRIDKLDFGFHPSRQC